MEVNAFRLRHIESNFIFQEMFPTPLEVLEAELLESSLEEVTIREGQEAIQVLTVPTLKTRKRSLSVDILRNINSRIILSHLYLNNRQLYDKRFKSNKAVLDLGNPLDFTSSYLEEVQKIKDSYSQILSPHHIPRFSDFSFLRLLREAYIFNLNRILFNPLLDKFKINNRTLPIHRAKFSDKHYAITMIYNGGPNYTEKVKLLYSGFNHVITNFTYYQLDPQFNSSNPLDLTEKQIHFDLDQNMVSQLISHGEFEAQMYIVPNVAQTAVEPSDKTDDLLLQVILNYIYTQILQSYANANLERFAMNFVNANWNIQKLIVKRVIRDIVFWYLEVDKLVSLITNAHQQLILRIHSDSNYGSRKDINIVPLIMSSISYIIEAIENNEY